MHWGAQDRGTVLPVVLFQKKEICDHRRVRKKEILTRGCSWFCDSRRKVEAMSRECNVVEWMITPHYTRFNFSLPRQNIGSRSWIM